MRQFITLVIVGSIFVALLALVGTIQPREDELARSIAAQLAKSTR